MAINSKEWPGLSFALLLGLLSMMLAKAPWLQDHGFSALTLAIAGGMLIGNTFYPVLESRMTPGIGRCKQTLLRAAIVLYGLRLTFADVAAVGWSGVLSDVAVLGSTFLLALWLGQRWLGLDRDSAILIGAGSSICGAAAVLATEPVVKGGSEKVAVAVATVVVFGTLAMFGYPVLYAALHDAGIVLSARQYGIFTGSTIHEVAQVVAAARAVSEEATGSAVIAKMLRVMMLAPFLLLLSAWLSRKEGRRSGGGMQIPWFAVGFILMTGLNSLITLPPAVAGWLIALDNLLLAMAMAALGLTTHHSAIRRAGSKPLILAAVLALYLLAGGALINAGLQQLFG